MSSYLIIFMKQQQQQQQQQQLITVFTKIVKQLSITIQKQSSLVSQPDGACSK